MQRASIAVLLGAALLAVAGCGGSRPAHTTVAVIPHLSSPPTAAELLHLARHVECPNRSQRLGGPAAVRRFHAVTAVECPDGFRTFPGKGKWVVVVRRVAVGHVASLQKYFEQPSVTKHPKGIVCTGAEQEVAVPVFIDAQGRQLVPLIPLDACDQPLRSKASADVRWHTIWLDRIRRVP